MVADREPWRCRGVGGGAVRSATSIVPRRGFGKSAGTSGVVGGAAIGSPPRRDGYGRPIVGRLVDPGAVRALPRGDGNLWDFPDESRWNLFEAHLARATPDQPASGSLSLVFDQVDAEQALQWVVRSTTNASIRGLRIEIDGRVVLDAAAAELPARGSVRYAGGDNAAICDAALKEVARLPVRAGDARRGPGRHPVTVSWKEPEAATLKVELRTLGPAIPVQSPGAR